MGHLQINMCHKTVSNYIIVTTVTSCFWEDWLWSYSFISSWIAVLSGFYHVHTCKLYAAYYYLLPGYFRLIEGSKNLVSWVGPEMPRAAWSWLHALMIQKMIKKRAINDQAVVGEVQFISASYLEYLYWLGVRHRSTYANALNLKIQKISLEILDSCQKVKLKTRLWNLVIP